MPRTTDSALADGAANNNSVYGRGANYVVEATNGAIYVFMIDGSSDVSYKKSTNKGVSWSPPVVLHEGTDVAIAVWYDRWTPGLTTDLIHVVYNNSGTDDIEYVSVDTASSDALSAMTTVFAGVTAVTSSGQLTITRARGGNVYCKCCIDQGTEGGFFRLPNANVPTGAWDAARTINFPLANTDQSVLMPGFAADNQDVILLFLDYTANTLYRDVYDDSADTWTQTLLVTPTNTGIFNTYGPQYAACCVTADSKILVAVWSGVPALNVDLQFFTVDETTITEGTPVILNSLNNQSMTAIGYDSVTGEIYVFYIGKEDGTDTHLTSSYVCYKVSNDGGTTWGSENVLSSRAYAIASLMCCPRTLGGRPLSVFLNTDNASFPIFRCIAPLSVQRSQSMIGT